MDAFEYRFTSKTGDVYIVRILNDGARFLSSEMISVLEKSDVEVWGIYLNRVGSCLIVVAMYLIFQQQILMLLLFLVLGCSCAPNIIFQKVSR